MGLARALSEHWDPVVLTSAGPSAGDEAWTVLRTVGRWADIAGLSKALREAPGGPILWQYVPHMYGRGGVNLGLPGLWARLHREGRRQVFLAHEIRADLTWHPVRLWYALNHRRQWAGVRRSADAVGISVERWLLRWQPEAPGRYFLAPSPSSIEPGVWSAGHRNDWRSRLQLPGSARVILHFGSYHAHKRPDWVVAAWREAHRVRPPVALAIIGSEWTPDLPASEKALFRALGYLPEAQVAEALGAADVLAVPFFDGASERRTSLMAGLAAGVAVATTTGASTGPTLASASFIGRVPASDPAGYARLVAGLLADDPARNTVATAGRNAYVRDYAWPVVGRRIGAALGV